MSRRTCAVKKSDPTNFRRFVTCKVSCKILRIEYMAIFKICNFDLESDVNH